MSAGDISVRGLHEYELEVLGESYVLLTFTTASAEDRWRHAHSVCRSVDALSYDAIISTYPAYDSVLVEFDATRIDSAGLSLLLAEIASGYSSADEEWLDQTVSYRMPVCFGLDIKPIAAELELTVDELIELQVSTPIRIRCRAAGGGLMMLNHDRVPPVARLASPEMRETFGGEFNMAGQQCSIGLSVGLSTTGWRTIGRTPVDVTTEFLKPGRNSNIGDMIVIEPIAPQAWTHHLGRPIALVGVAA